MKLSEYPINKKLFEDPKLKDVQLYIDDCVILDQVNRLLGIASQLKLQDDKANPQLCLIHDEYSYIMEAKLIGMPLTLGIAKVEVYIEIESPISINNESESKDDSLALRIIDSAIDHLGIGEAFAMMAMNTTVNKHKFARRALSYHLRIMQAYVDQQKLLET